MKYYLVKFNHPVFMHTTPNTTNDCIVYGFVVPRGRDADEYDIPCYVGYLAAMHEWSAGRETEFTLSPLSYWLDKDKHKPTDEWSRDIEERCRKRLGLDYTSLLIETEEDICSSSGMNDNLIVCKWKMDELSEMAEQDDICYVITFNRPIWLPKRLVWPKEEGYRHIHGFSAENLRKLAKKHEAPFRHISGWGSSCENLRKLPQIPCGLNTLFSIKEGKK